MSLPSFACSSSYGPECAAIFTYFPWLDGSPTKYPIAFRRRDGLPFSYSHFGRYCYCFSLIAAMTEFALNVLYIQTEALGYFADNDLRHGVYRLASG